MNKFIVSCQALADEPLHSPFIMGRMALAAQEGGAQGIRANGIEDILEIKKVVDLPIIGIIKKEYDDSDVYITPTIAEVTALVGVGVELIAVDATSRSRPHEVSLTDFYNQIRDTYPNQKLMADCSTFEEMRFASKLGFDYVSTTLFGYTSQSTQSAFTDLELFMHETKGISAKIIAEGQISTPELAGLLAQLNCFDAIVVGSAITRPQLITKSFYEGINYETN